MSLISYLQGNSYECIRFQEIIKSIPLSKKSFKSLQSNYPAFDTNRELKVPYNLSNAIEAALVGTAFDYLARFRIAQVVSKNSDEVISNIVADNFFERFDVYLSKTIINKLLDRYLKAKNNIKKTIETKSEFDDSIIKDICILAKLEQCWRSGRLPKDLRYLIDKPSDIVRNDLKKLLKVFEVNFIAKVVKSNSIVKYNPKFGACSYAIGGADADIYIDGTLYDYKCTKNLGYKGKDAQQVISYYILDKIAKKKVIFKNDISLLNCNINRIAIYSARLGEIYYVDIKDLDQEKLNKAILEIDDILFENKDLHIDSSLKN